VFNANINTIETYRNNGGLASALSFTLSQLSSALSGTGVTGLAQKVDNSFQSFTSPSLRITDRGLLVEPASTTTNSQPFNTSIGATWTQAAGTFAAVNSKLSEIPGQTAYEFVADATVGTLRDNSAGVFGSTIETLSALVETTATTSMTNAVTFFQMSANSGNVLRITYTWATGVILCNGSSTNVIGNVVPQGTGKNGGQLYLFSVSGIPDAPSQGITRRISCTPGGATSLNGQSIIIHYIKHEVGSVQTSPISGSRSADSVTLPVSINGTYHVRYVLDNGQNYDFLNQSVSSPLTVSNAVYERANQNDVTGGGAAKTDWRLGYINRIEFWNSNSINYHILGDSYVAGYNIVVYTPLYNYRPATFTTDGVPGSSLNDQAGRFDLTPQYYNDILIIYDGGLTDSAQTAIDSINRMRAHLTNPNRFIYMESTPNAQAGNEIGSVGYTDYLAKCAAIKAAFPAAYVPTLAIMQANGNGSAQDISNVANGWWPNSLLIDGIVHPNDKASRILAGLIRDALIARGF